MLALASSHNCMGREAGDWGQKSAFWGWYDKFYPLFVIRAVDPCCRLWSWFTLTMDLNSAWGQGGRRGEGEGIHTCISANKSLSRCLKERTQFKCELIFCYRIFVQARDGRCKPSCDSLFNKRIPFSSMLCASTNKISLLQANVILVLGQKSAVNGLAFLPECLLNG